MQRGGEEFTLHVGDPALVPKFLRDNFCAESGVTLEHCRCGPPTPNKTRNDSNHLEQSQVKPTVPKSREPQITLGPRKPGFGTAYLEWSKVDTLKRRQGDEQILFQRHK